MSMPFVFLWDAARHGTPKSYEHALEMWDDLYHRTEQEETASENLVAFGEEFGQFIDNSGEESWLNVLAGTGAYARRCRSAVLRLELPDTDWQPVLVKMVEVANKNGLVALHEDGATLFLPNGKVLPTSRAKAWKGLQAALNQEGGFPQTLAQFKKWLTPQVEMMLARHAEWTKLGQTPWGEKGPTYVSSKGGGINIYIYILISKQEAGFFFNIQFSIENELVSDICNNFRFASRGRVCGGGVLDSILGYDIFSDETTPLIKSNSDASKFIVDFERVLFPALNNICSIKELDALLNGDADCRYRDYVHNYVYKPQSLIVARLAGNPNFEELVSSLAEKPGRYGNAYVWNEEWPKLVKYLREEVKPIV